MASSPTIRKVRHRFLERTLLCALWCGAVAAFYMYRHMDLRVISARELTGTPSSEGEASGEWFSSEFAETRLFTELPSIEPLAAELASLRVQVDKHRRFRLVLDYVMAHHDPPPPMPQKFEYYSTEPLLPLPGATFRTDFGRPAPCITFQWSPMPIKNVKYILEIGKRKDFRYFRSFGAYTSHVQLRASMNADYYWRVRTTYQGRVTISNFARFNVVVPDSSPEAKRRELAERIRMPDAWLADVQVCP